MSDDENVIHVNFVTKQRSTTPVPSLKETEESETGERAHIPSADREGWLLPDEEFYKSWSNE